MAEDSVKVFTPTATPDLDIILLIGNTKIGEVESISYSIAKGKPFLGFILPTKRSISGCLIDPIIDRDILSGLLDKRIRYSDQIPKFEILITGKNGSGIIVRKSLLGCKIIHEHVSLPNKSTLTFKAESSTPWMPVN
jgi:hypothetical protein